MTEGSRKEDRSARGRRFEWTRRQIGSASSSSFLSAPSTSASTSSASSTSAEEGEDSTCFLLVSNPSAPIPAGIQRIAGFVSPEDEARIDREVDDDKFWKEGFDVRKRVQRFRLTTTSEADADRDAATTATAPSTAEGECRPREEAPPSLLRLSDRLRAETGLAAQYVSVEEIPVAGFQGMRKGEFASEHVVTTFDSPPFGSSENGTNNDDNDHPRFFVACVPIGRSAIQHLNKPSRRSANCWKLESPHHWFDVRINRGSLHVRHGECLEGWRSCFVASLEFEEKMDGQQFNTSASACDMIRVIKFCALPSGGKETTDEEEKKVKSRIGKGRDGFGYNPDVQEDARGSVCPNPMPPLPDLLTIVVTTSPIRSNPSTELLEKAMESFALGGTEFAYRCRKVIVCGACIPFCWGWHFCFHHIAFV
jgi:hypothetical protein